MKLFPIAAIAVALALQFHSAQAEPRTDQVRIVYEGLTDEKYRVIHDAMRERRILETVGSLLNSLRLPRELTLEMRGCQGRETAWYDRDTAVFCYEYVDLIQRHSGRRAARRRDCWCGDRHAVSRVCARRLRPARDPRDGARGGCGRLLLDLSDAAVSARGCTAPDRGNCVQHGKRGAQGFLGAARAAEIRRPARPECATPLQRAVSRLCGEPGLVQQCGTRRPATLAREHLLGGVGDAQARIHQADHAACRRGAAA